MWMILPAAAIYSLLGAWLLNTFPNSFTVGETMIVSEALTLVAMDTGIQLLALVCDHNHKNIIEVECCCLV